MGYPRAQYSGHSLGHLPRRDNPVLVAISEDLIVCVVIIISEDIDGLEQYLGGSSSFANKGG
jgi:hypothetical protein